MLWLTELSPGPWHDHAADRLKDILKGRGQAGRGTQVYVPGGPNDITTGRSPQARRLRSPRDIARTAISGKVRTYLILPARSD
jgi:hypothetical protein